MNDCLPNGSTSADAKLMVRLISDESCDKMAVTCNESRPLDIQTFNIQYSTTRCTCYIAGHSIFHFALQTAQ
jgi:hypothetical protein